MLKQCVGQDGGASTDQFLTDPRDCRFDPKALLCTGGQVPPACLTAEQVTTMRKYYAGATDPVNGQLINPGAPAAPRPTTYCALGLAFQERLPEPAFDGLFYWVFGPSFGYPSSPVNFANFDFHHDIDKVDDKLAAVLNANSTDLGEFREHGGKLLMYHGWADPLIPAQSSINYFNALVEKTAAMTSTEMAFSRSALANVATRLCSGPRAMPVCSWRPGMFHCAGGPGPNTFDALTPLVNWVEVVWPRRPSSPPNSSTIRRPRYR